MFAVVVVVVVDDDDDDVLCFKTVSLCILGYAVTNPALKACAISISAFMPQQQWHKHL